MGHILPKRKNAPPNFLYVVQYMANYQKINRKLKKYWGKIDSFLPWTQILKWTLRPSFCTQVKSSCVLQYIFIRSFDFGTKQELCPKKFMPGFGHSQKSALLKRALQCENNHSACILNHLFMIQLIHMYVCSIQIKFSGFITLKLHLLHSVLLMF